MERVKLLSIKFEPLNEESENLLGGFSSSLSTRYSNSGSGGANNCDGGNCIAGCGSGQEVNSATSCGVNIYKCTVG